MRHQDPNELLQAARTLDARTRRRESKLNTHREFILKAFSEGIRITTIMAILEKNCDLEVSYPNLRAWIYRQPEVRGAQGQSDSPRPRLSARPTTAAARKARESAEWDQLAARHPDAPLTLERDLPKKGG
ncbi:MAG TPA: hypothetical protein VIS99_12880 [Terrimicrobiaceae bacterium]